MSTATPTFESAVRRIVRKATRPADRERQIRASARRLQMRVIAIGKTKCAFTADEKIRNAPDECFQILLYEIDDMYLKNACFTPGKCIAKLDRQDLGNEAFEALGKALVA